MVQYILESKYRSTIPALPVNHGQRIDMSLDWMQPTEEEIAELENDVAAIQKMPHDWFFFPARLTQAHKLSHATYDIIGTAMNRRFLPGEFEYPSRQDGPKWLDLSNSPPTLTFWIYSKIVCSYSTVHARLEYRHPRILSYATARLQTAFSETSFGDVSHRTTLQGAWRLQ